MLRLMTSILTAVFVTSLTAGMVPGQDQDEPVAAKSKSSGSAKASDPVTTEAYPAKKKASSPANRQDYPAQKKVSRPQDQEADVRPGVVQSPSEAASRVGQQATVEFTVGSTGWNAAGFQELYSGRPWQEHGSFFVRFLKRKS